MEEWPRQLAEWARIRHRQRHRHLILMGATASLAGLIGWSGGDGAVGFPIAVLLIVLAFELTESARFASAARMREWSERRVGVTTGGVWRTRRTIMTIEGDDRRYRLSQGMRQLGEVSYGGRALLGLTGGGKPEWVCLDGYAGVFRVITEAALF